MAMLELAKHYGEGPLQLKRIAEDQQISIKYLEQLMAVVKSAGFVRSIRGAKGGYELAKAPSQITLSEVFKALEGPVIVAQCLEDKNCCTKAMYCVIRDVWLDVQNSIENLLNSMTIQDLVRKAEATGEPNYQI